MEVEVEENLLMNWTIVILIGVFNAQLGGDNSGFKSAVDRQGIGRVFIATKILSSASLSNLTNESIRLRGYHPIMPRGISLQWTIRRK